MRKCQNFRFSLRNQNRVLIMCGKRAVFCHNGPVIIQPSDCIASGCDHRLDGERHARLQTDAAAWLCEVRHCRIFVQVRSDAVAYQVADNAVAEALCVCTDRRRNLMKMMACFCVFDSFKKWPGVLLPPVFLPPARSHRPRVCGLRRNGILHR